MTDKRASSSRQRRANQNRANRESLAARRDADARKAKEAAAADTAATPAKRVGKWGASGTGAKASSGATKGTSGKGTSGKGDAAASAPAKGARPDGRQGRPAYGPSPVPETGPGVKGWAAAVAEIPGAKFVVIGSAMAIVVALLFGYMSLTAQNTPYLPKTAAEKHAYPACTQKVVDDWRKNLKAPADPKNKNKTIACPEDTSVAVYGPVAVVPYILMVLIGIGLLSVVRSARRRRSWLIGSFVLVMVSLLGGGGLPALFIAGLVGWGTWQTSKWERELLTQPEGPWSD